MSNVIELKKKHSKTLGDVWFHLEKKFETYRARQEADICEYVNAKQDNIKQAEIEYAISTSLAAGDMESLDRYVKSAIAREWHTELLVKVLKFTYHQRDKLPSWEEALELINQRLADAPPSARITVLAGLVPEYQDCVSDTQRANWNLQPHVDKLFKELQ